jgi:hypothetical protein
MPVLLPLLPCGARNPADRERKMAATITEATTAAKPIRAEGEDMLFSWA